MESLDSYNDDEEKMVAQFMEETYVKHITLVQSIARRFIQRCHIYEYITAKFEKIYDPKNGVYYYYNLEADKSSWNKPRLLLKGDIAVVSPTYEPDEAVMMIQKVGLNSDPNLNSNLNPNLKSSPNLCSL
jgi:hypothetical protein